MRHPFVLSAAFAVMAVFSALRSRAAGPAVQTVEYRAGEKTDLEFRRLDVYPPQNSAKGAPVLIFIHGGGWVKGNKEHHSGIGERFAKQGVLAVLPNYRLSPAALHPAHVEDVAAAVAWTFKHAAEFGGDPKKIYLAGHSAGGHLVALIAADPGYLAPHGLKPADLAGVIPISGIFDIAGMAGDAVHPSEYVQTIFGKDAAVWRGASPLFLIRPDPVDGPRLPRFLLAWAGHDPAFIQKNGETMRDALALMHHDPKAVTIDGANHSTIVWFLGNPGQKLSDAIYDFMGYKPVNP